LCSQLGRKIPLVPRAILNLSFLGFTGFSFRPTIFFIFSLPQFVSVLLFSTVPLSYLSSAPTARRRSVGSSECGRVLNHLVCSYEKWHQEQLLRLQDHTKTNVRFSCPKSNPNPASYTLGTECCSKYPMSRTVTGTSQVRRQGRFFSCSFHCKV
jgi:hypothetical protein